MFSSVGEPTACLVSALAVASGLVGCSSEADNLFYTPSSPDWVDDRGITSVCGHPYSSISLTSNKPSYDSVIQNQDGILVSMEKDTDGGVVVESNDGSLVGYIVETSGGEIGRVVPYGHRITYFNPSHTSAKAKLKDIKYDDIVLVTICY